MDGNHPARQIFCLKVETIFLKVSGLDDLYHFPDKQDQNKEQTCRNDKVRNISMILRISPGSLHILLSLLDICVILCLHNLQNCRSYRCTTKKVRLVI